MEENLSNGMQPPETGKEPPKSAQKPANQKKELTPAQMQKRRKMVVIPLFVLIFGAAMWLIFAPSGKDKEKTAQQAGLNVELPMPKDEGLVSDKRDAYEREALQNKERERVRSLQDYSVQLSDAGQQASTEYDESPSHTTGSPSPSGRSSSTPGIQSSTAAYKDINKQLDTWHEQPATAADEQTQLALEWRIQELERKQEEVDERKRLQEEELAMIENTYKLAAKYTPQTAGQPAFAADGTEVPSTSQRAGQTDKVIAQPVKQVRQNVVSLLAAPMDDAAFIQSYSQPRNLGFLTAAGNEGVQDKNSIRAAVYQTVTLTNGKELQIRLLEPMRAGNMLIPANTVVTGTCRIGGERLNVTVNSIQYADNIIPVELVVYDTDGQQGISAPGNDEITAAKEVAATLANSAGSSIMISDNAGSQLAADMGKGLIQGASQYLSKKMSVVKVTLKANYRLLLLPKTQ